MNRGVDVGVERSAVLTPLNCFPVLIMPQKLPSGVSTSTPGPESGDSTPDAGACDCSGRTRFRSAPEPPPSIRTP